MSIGIAISRLGRMRGTERFRVSDRPGGRILTKEPKPEKIADVEDDDRRYDVVTIGGYSYVVTGVQEVGMDAGVETVNGAFGEKNHILARFLTKDQVERRSFTWGRGKNHTRFAIAAILHGTRSQIPDWDVFGDWYNPVVPTAILAGRSIGISDTGGPVTLTLRIGTI